jgi:hypothetical protein
MLRLVRLVEQWQSVEEGLPDGWEEAHVALELSDGRQAARAAAVLGPANPGRSGTTVRFLAARGGRGVGPDAARRLLRRLDREGVTGTLALVEMRERELPPDTEERRTTLVAPWERELAGLPDDWSDLYAEVVLRSSDQLERAALLLAPLNPLRIEEVTGFRFRCAREFGYGASPQMVRRCLERCDAERITGTVRILRALSDTKPVATQGPVWYVGGKAV